MQYTKLGNTGLEVSRLCLGCMSFGDPENWTHKWTLREEDSRVIIKRALELGINFFDTANIYSRGVSEEILGRALKDYANRDETVLATKLFMPMREGGQNNGGLSRKEIMAQIDNSLARLGADYVDLYIIHRWDYNTPIEETMEALHDVVKAGKARYIGASAMFAWQFQKALFTAEKHGWTKFVSMQNHMNLLYREEEREMMPLLQDAKVASTPYSPLAAGRLSRPVGESTFRKETDAVARMKYDTTAEADNRIVERVGEVSDKYGASRSQISLAWLLQKEMVAAPIIGSNKITHLEDAAAAVDIRLAAEDVAYLEELYVPHSVVGPA